MEPTRGIHHTLTWPAVMMMLFALCLSCGTREKSVRKIADIAMLAADDMRLSPSSGLRKRITDMRASSASVADTVVVMTAIDVADSLLQRKQYSRLVRFVSDVAPIVQEIAGDGKGIKTLSIELRCYMYEAYRYMSLYDRAAKGMLKEMSLAERLKLKESLALLSNNLATLYMKQGMYDEATKLCQRSVKLNEELNDSNFLVVNYNNLSSIYYNRRDDHKAIEYSFLSLHFMPQQDSTLRMLVQRNISTKYTHIQEYGMALRQLQPVVGFFERNGMAAELPYTYSCYAYIMWKTGDIAAARHYYEKAYGLIGDCRKDQQKEIAGSYAEFCDSVGDKADELAAVRKCLEIAEEINEEISDQEANSLTHLHQYEMEQTDRSMQEMHRERRVFWIWTTVLAVLAAAALAAFFVTVARSRRRRAVLDGRVSELQGQLQKASMESTRNNELVTKMSRELQTLQRTLRTASKGESMEALRSLTSEVMRSEKRDDSMMHAANAEFFRRLVEKYPQLTPNDLRLAAMLRQGLSSKEIADVMVKEVRSVETARNRLRKKLGITPETDLCRFFMQL